MHGLIALSVGPGFCERVFQGWRLVFILVVMFLGILAAMSYLIARQMPGKAAEWQARVPPIPTAFTGRDEEIQRIVDCIVQKDVRVISVTGGPGYGKSSVAIAASHQLMEHRIPVCYVSLSEAESIETFEKTLRYALTMKTDRNPDKFQKLSLVGLLKGKTVIVLDNADYLTLNQTKLREDFMQLLKRIVAENIHLRLVVVTRYHFRIIGKLEEIHLQPLASSQAWSLLRTLIHASGLSAEELTEEQLQMIINVTGGIPLAIRIVGDLVTSVASPITEILQELSIDPISTLSDDRFTPDEQLKRCIDLSYKYLDPVWKRCFLFAAHFPGSFDHQAQMHIFYNLTGDKHCLIQLEHRSLVEYNRHTKRYNVHALLRVFARDHSDARNLSLENYYKLYTNHYIAILTEKVRRTKASGDVDNLYTTLDVEHPNFLQVLQLLSTNLTYLVAPKNQLELALEAFQIMQAQFPHEALFGWWTRLLKVCLTASNYQNLTLQSLQLSTKVAQLHSYLQDYSLARFILLSANMCVARDHNLVQSFQNCKYPQLSIYTTMLQDLAHVSEKEGFLHEAHACNKTIQRCLRDAPNKKAEEIISQNFCSDGISHVREVYENFRDFQSALQLFDALLKCKKESEATNSINLLEDAFENELDKLPALSADSIKRQHCMRIAKRMYLVTNHEGEAKWLVRSAEYMQNQDCLAFNIYYRLTKLYWLDLNDKHKALESGRAAYAIARNLCPGAHCLDQAWRASVRLADILSQIGGHQEEAVHYFEEALGRVPLINATTDFIYEYQNLIEVNLMSLYFQLGQFSMFFQHYGQWAKFQAVQTPRGAARKIKDLYYDMLYAQLVESSSLASVDDSLNWQLKGLNIVWKYVNTHIGQTYESTIWCVYFVLFCIIGVLLFVVTCCCVLTLLGCFSPIVCVICIGPFILAALILYEASVLVYCFHYFVYVALVKHKVWKPNFPSTTVCTSDNFALSFFCQVAYLSLLIALMYLKMSVTRHNFSMLISDDDMYFMFA